MTHVVHVRVPSYENLSLERVLNAFSNHPEVFRYLPDGKELRKVPKQWVVNVMATVIGEPFIEWVKQQINDRNKALIMERKLGIELDEEIAAAFHASTAVSRKYSHSFAAVISRPRSQRTMTRVHTENIGSHPSLRSILI